VIALALPFLLAFAASAAAQPTPTPTPNPVFQCAGKIVGASGLRNYTNGYLLAATDCAIANLTPTRACDAGELQGEIDNLDEELLPEVAQCELPALDSLCPLESDTIPEINEALAGIAPTSVKSQLQAIVDDVFETSYPDACTRPPGTVSSDALQCADKIQAVLAGQETVERLEECFFSCERPRLNQAGLELCVDDITGDPIKDDVAECLVDTFEALELLDDRCDAAAIEELGCPLGAESLSGLKNAIQQRVTSFVQELNLGIFHSDCQTNLPGGPSAPIPAEVTLLPSNTHKQLSCGQTIDGTFMGSDKSVNFDTDLDCSGATTATDGVIVAKAGVIMNGRSKTRSIRGPARSSLRTGTGIRLAPGVGRIQIKNFKSIENFGVGIEDAVEGNNKKLVIVKTTVRRNVFAGLRLRSPRVKIEMVTADKNGIGMDLSGDGTKVKASEAKGSLYDPKVGIKLSGIDENLNGTVVQISGPLNTIELNQGVGIWITEGGHTVNENQIRSNVGAGILVEVLGVGSKIKTNNLKSNGAGVIVLGDGNLIDSNTCEENLGDGFLVAGLGNTLLNNKSGKKTDKGNIGAGFRITGQSVSVQSNAAEANLGSGFVVTGTTTEFSANTSESNGEHGFDIQSAGNVFDSCSAEANGPEKDDDNLFHEWVLVAGNSDTGDNNSAGGDTIRIPAAGGFCDFEDDCP